MRSLSHDWQPRRNFRPNSVGRILRCPSVHELTPQLLSRAMNKGLRLVLSSPIKSCLSLKSLKSPKTSRISSMRSRRGLRRSSKRIPTLFLTRIQYLQRETSQSFVSVNACHICFRGTRFVLCVSFKHPLQSSIFNLCIFCLVYHHYHYIHNTCSTKQTYQSASHSLQRVSISLNPSMELERPRPVVLEGEVSILPPPPAPFPTEQLRPALRESKEEESSVRLHHSTLLMSGSTETYQCSTTILCRYTRRPPFCLSHIRRTPQSLTARSEDSGSPH